jgi:hypothetical protein
MEMNQCQSLNLNFYVLGKMWVSKGLRKKSLLAKNGILLSLNGHNLLQFEILIEIYGVILRIIC